MKTPVPRPAFFSDDETGLARSADNRVAAAALAAPAAVALFLPARLAGFWPWVAAAGLAGAGLLILRRPARRGDTPMAGFGAAFLAATLLAWAFSLGKPLGTESVTKLALAAALAFVAWTHGAPRHRRFFETLLCAVAGLYATVAWAALLWPAAATWRPGNPQYQAFWIALALVAVGHRAFQGAGDCRRAARIAAVAALAGTLLLLKSRSGLLAAAVGATVLLYQRGGARRAILGAGLLATAAFGLWTVDRLDLFKTSDVFAWTRPALWRAALAGAIERPLLGWGPGLFAWAYAAHRVPLPVDGVYFDHAHSFAHNDFLQVGAECGLGTLLFLVVFLVGHFRRAWKHPGPDAGWLAAAIAFCCVNFPFYAPGNALLGGALLAVTADPRPAGSAGSRAWGSIPVALLFALAALNTAAAATLHRQNTGAPLLSRARVEVLLGRADQRMHGAGAGPSDFEAARADLQRIQKTLSLPEAARDEAHLITDHMTPPRWAEALRLWDKALGTARTNTLWWFEKSVAEAQSGRFAEAERAVDRARALEPRFGAAALLKARLLIARGAAEEALRLLNPLTEAPPPPAGASSYARAILTVDGRAARVDRVAALARAGRTAEARRALDDVSPRGSEGRRQLETLLLDGGRK